MEKQAQDLPRKQAPAGRVQRRTCIGVLDVAGLPDRDLASTVEACDLEVVKATSLEDLKARLAESSCLVALVAFEAIWDDPQKSVTTLRQVGPHVRILVAYSDGTARLHLGRRLWAVNLIDYFLLRSLPPHEMRPILRQAFAESLIEVNRGEFQDGTSLAGHEHYAAVRFISELSQAFNTQRRVEDLLRLLHRKLAHLVEYDLLQVLTVEDDVFRLFNYPTRALPHEEVWKLAGATCQAVRPFVHCNIEREDLVMFENAPFCSVEVAERAYDGQGEHIASPMLVHGELVGCLSLIVPRHAVVTAENRMFVSLVSTQLGAAIRNAQALKAAENRSLSDELTGVRNRRYLGVFLPQEWRRTERYGLQLSLAMLDLDFFKRVNDTYGHLIGDQVLRGVAQVIRQELRDTDEVIRFGGEEFLVIMPETRPSEAIAAVERVRQSVCKEPIYQSSKTGPISLALSAGVASYPLCAVQSVEELLHNADEALYEAKAKGRNQVCVSTGKTVQTMRRAGDRPASAAERRRAARIDSQLTVRYVQLPEFEGRLRRTTTINISSSGVALIDPRASLRQNNYVLVYIGESETPLLGRVAWAKDAGQGRHAAGIEFINASDVEARIQGTQRIQVVPKAIVIVEDQRVQAVVCRILRAANYDIIIVAERDRLPEAGQLSRFALIVVGESSLSSWFGERLEQVRDGLRPPGRIVVIGESRDPEHALATIEEKHIDHLVPADVSDEALFATLNKLLLGEYFGMQKYLLWGVTPKSWTIIKPHQKEQVLIGVRDVARDVHCHPRITDLLILAVEEMLINAMYQAREEPIDGGVGPVRVECGSDGRLLAVSVIDDKGTLCYRDIYRGLGTALRQQREGLDLDSASANLGFRIMLGCLSQLAINVEPGRCTEIIGIVDLRKSLREYRNAVPTLGLFAKET